jgi:hypothetical protein
MVWGWVVVSVFTMSVALALAGKKKIVDPFFFVFDDYFIPNFF